MALSELAKLKEGALLEANNAHERYVSSLKLANVTPYNVYSVRHLNAAEK